MQVGQVTALITAETQQFDQAIDASGRKAQRFGDTVRRGFGAVGKASAATLTAMAGGVAGFSKTVLDAGLSYNVLQQNSRAALSSIMGSAEAAAKQMDKLDEFARTSPFSKDVFITAQQQMLGFGMAAENVLPTLDAIQQAVAATGGSSHQVGELAYVLAQISSVGKVTATDLMQLGIRGVDAASMIGDQMGKTSGEIREMISSGAIDANEFISMITTGMQERFGGATASIKEQWSGAADRIKASTRDIGAAIGAVFIDPKGGGQAVTWGNQVADIFRSVEALAKQAMPRVAVLLEEPFGRVSDLLTSLNNKIANVDVDRMFTGLDKLKPYTPIIAGLTSAVLAWNTQMLASIPIIGNLVPALNPLVAGIAGLVLAVPQAREAIARFADSLRPAFSALKEAGVVVADVAIGLVERLTPGFDAVLNTVADVATAFTSFLPPLANVLQAALPLASAVSAIAEAFDSLPGPIKTAAAAFLVFRNPIGNLVTSFESIGAGLMDAVGYFRIARNEGESFGASLVSAITPASSKVTGLAGAIQGAIATAFNPMNLAVGGLAIAFGLWADAQAKAAERQREITQKSQEFLRYIDETTGKLDQAAARLQIIFDLEDQIDPSKMREWGLEYEDVADAILGVEDAQRRVGNVIDENRGKYDTRKYVNGIGDLVDAMQVQEGALSRSRVEWDRNRQIQDASRDSTEANTEALRRQKAELDNTASATANYSRLLEQHALLTDRAREAVAEFGSAGLSEQTLFFDETTEAGQRFNGTLRDMAQTALNLRNEMEKSGSTTGEIRAQMATQRADFVANAEAMGMSRDRAEELADALNLIPGNIRSEVDVEIGQALQKLGEVKIEMDTTTGTILLDGNPVPAQGKLGDFLEEVAGNPGTVEINGNFEPADMTVLEWILRTSNRTGTVIIDGNSMPAEVVTAELLKAIENGDPVVDIYGDDVPIMDVFNAFVNYAENRDPETQIKGNASDAQCKIDGLDGQRVSVNVDANTSTAESKVASMRARLSLPVHVPIVPVRGGGSAYPGGGTGGSGMVATMYAHGGFHEHRVAQISPAGAYRVWAEDETGGEAYIPLSVAKRPRSLRILDEVAARFGYLLVNRGTTRRFADGDPGPAPVAPTVQAGAVFPSQVVLRVGDREFTAYVSTVADSRIRQASEREERWA